MKALRRITPALFSVTLAIAAIGLTATGVSAGTKNTTGDTHKTHAHESHASTNSPRQSSASPSSHSTQSSNAASDHHDTTTNTSSTDTSSSSSATNGFPGTIKIKSTTSPDTPPNEPHPSTCAFKLDFFGFNADTYGVTISVWPPTGRTVLRTDSVTIPTTERGDAFQASRTYDLTDDLSAFTPQPQQGFHVRVDVTEPGQNGSKTKVFWLGGCTIVGGVTGTPSSVPTVSGVTVQKTPATKVLGLQITRPTVASSSVGGAVAMTGLSVLGLLVLAAILLLIGALMRRRAAARE